MGPVGDPRYAREIERTVSALGTRELVHFLAPARHGSQAFRDSLAAADVFLLPSRHEPFGIAVLEAWAAGIPVVASQAGQLSRLVRDQALGLSIGEDDPQLWSAATEAFLEQTSFRQAIVKRARSVALRIYSWDAVVTRLADIYTQIGVARRRETLRV